MCSTSFGDDCTGPSVLPCSEENALVDNRAAAPNSCLPSLELSSPIAAGGLLPTGEASTATKTTFNKSLLQLYATEETNSNKKKLWTSIPPAWSDSSFWTYCLLPLSTGGSSRQNQEKIGRSIQAVFKVVSPAHFWDRGASCFV